VGKNPGGVFRLDPKLREFATDLQWERLTAWAECGGPYKAAIKLGVTNKLIYQARQRVEGKAARHAAAGSDSDTKPEWRKPTLTEEYGEPPYGRKGRFDQTVTATPEHPFLIERAGQRMWEPAERVRVGDVVFVRATSCRVTGEPIPFWMKMGRNANPMDEASCRDKVSATKGGKNGGLKRSGKHVHFTRDVLPACERLAADDWRVIPVGGPVQPDIVAIKDGRVVAFEVENAAGGLLAHRQGKYEGAEIVKYLDGVEWIDSTPRVEQPRSWYEYDAETGLCKVMVGPLRQRRIVHAEASWPMVCGIGG
jgi:hypothetical protein